MKQVFSYELMIFHSVKQDRSERVLAVKLDGTETMSDHTQQLKLPDSFTFSQSSLQDYTDCPRRFQLRYIEQLHWPAVETEPVKENEIRQQEGQLFHRLVQQHLIGIGPEKLNALANTANLERWWENFLHTDFKLVDSRKFTELTLSAPVGENRLMAKYDLVAVQPGGKVVIYDWKTYKKRPRDEWMAARLQTRVYQAMIVQARAYLNDGIPFEPEGVEMIYWYAETPSDPANFPYDTTLYKREWKTLTGLISEIKNHQHFPLTEDERKCAYCTYRSYCNRGIEAGNAEEMEQITLTGTDANFEQIAEIEY
jgi:CRISPR/Cas system-associated exonuclease Cas4 (RecB family)